MEEEKGLSSHSSFTGSGLYYLAWIICKLTMGAGKEKGEKGGKDAGKPAGKSLIPKNLNEVLEDQGGSQVKFNPKQAQNRLKELQQKYAAISQSRNTVQFFHEVMRTQNPEGAKGTNVPTTDNLNENES